MWVTKQRFGNLRKLLSVGSLNWDFITEAPGKRRSVAKSARIDVQRYKTAAKPLLWRDGWAGSRPEKRSEEMRTNWVPVRFQWFANPSSPLAVKPTVATGSLAMLLKN